MYIIRWHILRWWLEDRSSSFAPHFFQSEKPRGKTLGSRTTAVTSFLQRMMAYFKLNMKLQTGVDVSYLTTGNSAEAPAQYKPIFMESFFPSGADVIRWFTPHVVFMTIWRRCCLFVPSSRKGPQLTVIWERKKEWEKNGNNESNYAPFACTNIYTDSCFSSDLFLCSTVCFFIFLMPK